MASTATTFSATTQPSVEEVRPYQLLAGLQVADVATTWVILSQWTHRAEGNPIVASFIEYSGLTVAMVALLVVKLAVVYVLYEKGTGVNLMSALYGLVVFNNALALGLALFG